MILKDIWMDVKAVQERDPAARNALEVLLLYQGVHALIWHRVAHWFYEHHMFFIARLISQVARFFTLIEIHPGAQLGHGILIDSARPNVSIHCRFSTWPRHTPCLWLR